MKRFFPPQSEIRVYETGFNEIDLLDRSDIGRQLSCLVDYFEEPIVLALDGRWGDGKSFFLKCWTGSCLLVHSAPKLSKVCVRHK